MVINTSTVCAPEVGRGAAVAACVAFLLLEVGAQADSASELRWAAPHRYRPCARVAQMWLPAHANQLQPRPADCDPPPPIASKCATQGTLTVTKAQENGPAIMRLVGAHRGRAVLSRPGMRLVVSGMQPSLPKGAREVREGACYSQRSSTGQPR